MANRLHSCVGRSGCNFAMLFWESLHGYGRRTSNSRSALYCIFFSFSFLFAWGSNLSARAEPFFTSFLVSVLKSGLAALAFLLSSFLSLGTTEKHQSVTSPITCLFRIAPVFQLLRVGLERASHTPDVTS